MTGSRIRIGLRMYSHPLLPGVIVDPRPIMGGPSRLGSLCAYEPVVAEVASPPVGAYSQTCRASGSTLKRVQEGAPAT